MYLEWSKFLSCLAVQMLQSQKAGTPENSNPTIRTEVKPKRYIVKSGDTLGRIAIDNSTTVSAIKEINNLKSDNIFPGNVLKLSKNAFMQPAPGRITSNWGWRLHPIEKVNKLHAGMDIAQAGIVPILAAYDGTVTKAQDYYGLGQAVFYPSCN